MKATRLKVVNIEARIKQARVEKGALPTSHKMPTFAAEKLCMGRSQETFNKKEVRKNKEKKRKDKEKKRQMRREGEKSGLDDMIAWVDEHGNITDTPPDPDRKVEEIKAEDIEIGVPSGRTQAAMDPIRKGTVTFFNDSKGFGFIRDGETKEDVFVHINNVEEDIREGNLVSFEVEKGPKGPSAVRVKVVR